MHTAGMQVARDVILCTPPNGRAKLQSTFTPNMHTVLADAAWQRLGRQGYRLGEQGWRWVQYYEGKGLPNTSACSSAAPAPHLPSAAHRRLTRTITTHPPASCRA